MYLCQDRCVEGRLDPNALGEAASSEQLEHRRVYTGEAELDLARCELIGELAQHVERLTSISSFRARSRTRAAGLGSAASTASTRRFLTVAAFA
jgi:hypothetical protein